MQVIKNDEKRKIGWIGLGKTGHQLAYLLVRAGYNAVMMSPSLIRIGLRAKILSNMVPNLLAPDANSVAAESDYLLVPLCWLASSRTSSTLIYLMENSEYDIYDDIKTGSIVVNHSPRDPPRLRA